ncbi:MAG: SDR family oxidoreductase [Hespellia sp.]|jgi:NAD(P)-dependent dehydrogenase (short-subunit alcohol dehydrogenase family)|nr:SDR family oxidoreductase [Hespellia sp.]
MDLNMKGKTVLVTGGSKGIGMGCCTVFAEEGCNVVMNYRSDEKSARANAEALEASTGVKVQIVKADVSVEEEVVRMFQELDERGVQLDYLVNNAGNTKVQPVAFQEITTKTWRESQEGTLNSAFFVAREFTKRAIEEKREAAIVNVLAKGSFHPSRIYNSPYVMAKGGLAALTTMMAKELIRHHIRVNGIVPGYVQTEHLYKDGEPLTEEKRKLLPHGEFATPYDMGNAAAFLCSERSRQMIGIFLDCSGGTMI